MKKYKDEENEVSRMISEILDGISQVNDDAMQRYMPKKKTKLWVKCVSLVFIFLILRCL